MYFHQLHLLQQYCTFLADRLPNTPIYLVGGVIRDILLGRNFNPYDIDATCAGDPKQLAQNINKKGLGSFQTEKYGTLTLVQKSKNTIKDDDTTQAPQTIHYEITPFRSEQGYSNHRHPDQIDRSDDLLLDSHRRDFTINALYYTTITFPQLSSPSNTNTIISAEVGISTAQERSALNVQRLTKNGTLYLPDSQTLIIQSHDLIARCIIAGQPQHDYIFSLIKLASPDTQPATINLILDPQSGLQDMIDAKIRAVGDPDVRFAEDALRILRALRFAITLQGVDFDPTTRTSLKKNYFSIQRIAAERITQELFKAANSNNLFGFITLLDEINILKYIFPSLHANKNNHQPVRRHPFDVFTHSLLTLHHIEKLTTDPLLKLAALYHDVGKTEQYYSHTLKLTKPEAQKMYGSWINHIHCGPDMTTKDFQALKFSRKQVETITRYVAQHMKPGQIAMAASKNQEKKVRLLLSEAGYERTHNLFLLTIADRRGQYNPLQHNTEDEINHLMDILEQLHESEGQFTLRDLAINGNDLMSELGFAPGPQLKILLNNALEWVMEDISNRNNKDKILKQLQKKEIRSS